MKQPSANFLSHSSRERAIVELRERLRNSLVAKGFLWDDAEDLASEVAIECHLSRNYDSLDRASQWSYALRAAVNRGIDFRSAPGRVLGQRLNIILDRPGLSPVSWFDGGDLIVGTEAQRVRPPIRFSSVAQIEASLPAFCAASRGLNGTSPTGQTTRAVVNSLLSWLGHPCEKRALVAILVALIPIPSRMERLHGFRQAHVPPPEAFDPADFRCAIRALPYRMRVAVLLAMHEDELQLLFSDQPRFALKEYLDEWVPQPRIEEIEFPMKDDAIAAKLRVTKGNLYAIRSRALDRLSHLKDRE